MNRVSRAAAGDPHEVDRLRAHLHALDLGRRAGCLSTSSRRPARRCRPHRARRAVSTSTVSLRADPLTVFMLCMVTFISTLVAIYSAGYMHGDPGYPRFFAYIALFVFSMTMLVSVSNFLLLYVFWEAVGLVQLSADRLLVSKARGGGGGQEGVPRQSHRRLRLRARRVSDLDDVRHAELSRCTDFGRRRHSQAGGAAGAGQAL